MRTIWKFNLELGDWYDMFMPRGAKAISVGVQQLSPREQAELRLGDSGNLGRLCLWAEVDSEAPKVLRRVSLVGTGNPADHLTPDDEYVGTALLADGRLVIHVYIRKELPCG